MVFDKARELFMTSLQAMFDLGPDFTDKILIHRLRDFANELNELADKEEKKLKGKG